jgi:hypothetical protein
MKRDFEVVDGAYLVQASYELDLHNNVEIFGLNYSVRIAVIVYSMPQFESRFGSVGQSCPMARHLSGAQASAGSRRAICEELMRD